MLTKGKWIRIECDFAEGVHHNEFNPSTLDLMAKSFKKCLDDADNYGWKEIKGKWYCPRCVNEILKNKKK